MSDTLSLVNPLDKTISLANSQASNPTLFAQVGTDLDRWNQAFPYRFALWTVPPNGGNPGPTQEYIDLPIPPEALEITTPFAINNSVTLNGIVEQHNAFPIQSIFLRGSTGMLNRKNVRAENTVIPNMTIVGGTLNAVNALVKTVTAGGSSTAVIKESDLTVNTLLNTGYAQFLALKNFFESYAILKKSGDNPNLRLVFEIFKEQYAYVCTPKTFRMVRNAESPFEFKYEIQLEAWQRLKTQASGQILNQNNYTLSQLDKSTVQNILNGFQQGQNILNSLSGVIAGVRQDIDKVLDIGRSTTLFLKNTVGLGLTLADLPANILLDIKSAVFASWNNLQGLTNNARGISSAIGALPNQVALDYQNVTDYVNLKNATHPTQINGPTNTLLRTTVDNIFENPTQHYGFFSSINISNLVNVTNTIQKLINTEIQRCASFTIFDFQNMVTQYTQAMNVYGASVGADNATYEQTYGIVGVNQIRAIPTSDDYLILNIFSQNIDNLYNLIANATAQAPLQSGLPFLNFVANAANSANIPFEIPKSKYPVPFPYGGTLEQIAQRYLGNADRWMEIAVVNGLRSPYVDEIGFTVPLQTNAATNYIIVNNVDNLVIGQNIWLQSNAVPNFTRIIQNIVQLSPDQFQIYLSGDPTLQNLVLTDNPFLQAFLPYTVNSQCFVSIPSPKDASGTTNTYSTPQQMQVVQELLQSGGSDLLLDIDNDLIVTQNGDCRLAVGIQNIVQTIKLLLEIPQGSLLHHPEIGINLVGNSLANLSASDIAKAIKTAIDEDNFFNNWQYTVNVAIDGPVANVTVSVTAQNSTITLPINFSISRI